MKAYKLGDFCTVGSSKRIHLSDYVESGVPFYRSKEVIELSENKSLSENLFISEEKFNEIKRKYPTPKVNDILITSVGTLGKVYLIKDDFFYFKDGNLTWLRNYNKEIIDVDYLYQWLRSPAFKTQIENNNIGAVQKALTIDYLKSVDIILPQLSEQQKIAQVLSTLDRKIALNQQINAELEKMAKTLYDYWFVQFDFPDENSNPYKSSGGEMIYNPELKREVPKGWEVAQLSEYLDCDRKKLGKNHSLSFINYLDTSNLTNNIIADIQFLNVEKDKIPNRANMVISHNDILFSTVRPNQNHFGLIKKPIKNLIGSTGFAVLTHKENAELNSIFYLCIIRENNLQKLISISESAKSSYPSISKNDILNLFICLPKDINYLEKMAKKFDSIFEKQSTIEKENTQLTQLRDFLLPMLMNGQVEVDSLDLASN